MIIKAYSAALKGRELYLACESEITDIIKIKIKDRQMAWDMYCKHYKITIEKISEEEINKI